jgi:hypothetical protein
VLVVRLVLSVESAGQQAHRHFQRCIDLGPAARPDRVAPAGLAEQCEHGLAADAGTDQGLPIK